MDISSRAARVLSHSAPELNNDRLTQFVGTFVERRAEFLAAAAHGSPLYLFDPAALRRRAREFAAAFRNCRDDVQVFFALKSNSYRGVSELLVEEGINLDVSSGTELELALSCSPRRIVFSGPGKTDAELRLAVDNADRVTLLADSINELQRIERIAAVRDVTVTVGIRLTTDDNGIWRKFGIPLAQLREAFELADSLPHVDLRGLQFHISWNLNADKQSAFIRRLGAELETWTASRREQIAFIDIGGGFWPPDGEWMQRLATPQGMIESALGDDTMEPLTHYAKPSISIDEFAAEIVSSLLRRLPADMRYTLYTEPGRWLCHESMHMLLTVVDRKAEDVVITDGGTNAIGWDRYELDYFPIINLTRPSTTERPCLVAGSLCTPHDLWGYSYFGSDIQPGDVLLVPNQGAYTWSLRQEFIKPLPPVVHLQDAATEQPAVTAQQPVKAE